MVKEETMPGPSEFSEKVKDATTLSLPSGGQRHGGIVPAKFFSLSENERAVEEWRETQKNRPGRSSEHGAVSAVCA